MRRRDLTDDELQKVIALREAHYSWLAIQNQTSIPRRAAQRAYEAWKASQSRQELQSARREVAAEEFRYHLGQLVQLAQGLLEHVRILPSYDETRNAEAVLDELWRTNFFQRSSLAIPSWYPSDQQTEQEQVIRRNKMLFESLKEHTKEKIRWEALEDWKQAWDGCKEALDRLRREVDAVVKNRLVEYPTIKAEVEVEGVRTTTSDILTNRVLQAVWFECSTGQVYQDCVFNTQADGRNVRVRYSQPEACQDLVFTDAQLAGDAAKVCTLTLQLVKQEGTFDEARIAAARLRQKSKELKEMLHDLRLRPLILRTQCELCPA